MKIGLCLGEGLGIPSLHLGCQELRRYGMCLLPYVSHDSLGTDCALFSVVRWCPQVENETVPGVSYVSSSPYNVNDDCVLTFPVRLRVWLPSPAQWTQLVWFLAGSARWWTRRCGQGCAFALRDVVLVFITERVLVSIRSGVCAGSGALVRPTWYGACVFIAECTPFAREARVGVQIRRCGPGLRSG